MTARESRPSREERVFRHLLSEPRTEQGHGKTGGLAAPENLRFSRTGVNRVTFTPLSMGFCLLGSFLEVATREKWVWFGVHPRYQKREPARVRLGRESQSGGWHRPHGPSRYPSTPLPHGTDGLRANWSTCTENLASGGAGAPDPTREETSAFTLRRMS